jgi:hypothetical protein
MRVGEKHMGSSIDDFLKEEGIFEKTQVQAIKEVADWQLAEADGLPKNFGADLTEMD